VIEIKGRQGEVQMLPQSGEHREKADGIGPAGEGYKNPISARKQGFSFNKGRNLP